MGTFFLNKSQLATKLGWSRPTLDKRLRTDPHFPVQSRGDQSGGWTFDLQDVLSYLGIDAELRPLAANPVRDAISAWPAQAVSSLPLFDGPAFAAASKALEPKRLPIIEEPHIRRDGLSEAHLTILSQFLTNLPADFGKGTNLNEEVEKALAAANRTAALTYDRLWRDLAGAPDQLPLEDAREACAGLMRMLGALFDLAERALLEFRAATADQRNAVRELFDSLRSETLEDFRATIAG